MKIEKYRGHIIGWSTGRRKYLIDALTARAIRRDKATPAPRIGRQVGDR